MKKNLIGQQFGLWTVIDEAEPYRNPKTGYVDCACWLCRCVCGNEKILPTTQLHRKNNYGCGCKGVDSRIRKNEELNCMEYTTRQGKTFLFDECDLELVKSSLWYLDESTGYITSNKNGSFHRAIFGLADSKQQVDHINGIRTDNRRCNLRITDNQHNCWNSGISSKNTSGHKHVSRSKYKGWRVRIAKDGFTHTWYTEDYDEACKIAEEKHKELFGEYSVYNRKGMKT